MSDGALDPEDQNRVWSEERLIDAIALVAENIGITRVSDLTGVDRIRLPQFAVVCPRLNWPPVPGMVSVCSGKGLTHQQAEVSALMEAVERASATRQPPTTLVGSYRVLGREHPLVDPHWFASGLPENGRDIDLEWLPASSLVTRDRYWVPATLVVVPYRPVSAGVWAGPGTSIGLAAGSTITQARVHGLYEVIEHDAAIMACARGWAHSIDLTTVRDPSVAFILEAISSHARAEVRDITTDVGVPAFEAVLRGPEARIRQSVALGQASHLDPSKAVASALVEAAQARVTTMVALREDVATRREGFDETAQDWLEVRAPSALPPTPLPDRPEPDLLQVERILAERIMSVTGHDVLAVDLTRADIGIPVVRVLAPGLEWGLDNRWGPRAMGAMAASAEPP